MRATRLKAWYRLCRSDLNEGSSLARKSSKTSENLDARTQPRDATCGRGGRAGDSPAYSYRLTAV
jgi:hypothetical protein